MFSGQLLEVNAHVRDGMVRIGLKHVLEVVVSATNEKPTKRRANDSLKDERPIVKCTWPASSSYTDSRIMGLEAMKRSLALVNAVLSASGTGRLSLEERDDLWPVDRVHVGDDAAVHRGDVPEQRSNDQERSRTDGTSFFLRGVLALAPHFVQSECIVALSPVRNTHWVVERLTWTIWTSLQGLARRGMLGCYSVAHRGWAGFGAGRDRSFI